ncbi:uncharacterized protein BCR38DRAFT_44437 [Pseudomassariella vexata]|uniref:Uncharacterized protein n=1 Tax=Pseudomassariella vexata TaxID=1141098 RepID=A0A1Y2DN02_9PEZI|nr:uncharacterized protein BCR38DRAFT_44437 [Pseudomassariella vexata]ORY60673.1 hypothetical protein BCR38DRAFT_44437 [Pseudomassariella vexata]
MTEGGGRIQQANHKPARSQQDKQFITSARVALAATNVARISARIARGSSRWRTCFLQQLNLRTKHRRGNRLGDRDHPQRHAAIGCFIPQVGRRVVFRNACPAWRNGGFFVGNGSWHSKRPLEADSGPGPNRFRLVKDQASKPAIPSLYGNKRTRLQTTFQLIHDLHQGRPGAAYSQIGTAGLGALGGSTTAL